MVLNPRTRAGLFRGAVALILIAIAAAVFLIARPASRDASDGKLPVTAPRPVSTAAPEPNRYEAGSGTSGGASTAVSSPVPPPMRKKRLYVLGASYTQGIGATPETAGYAYLLAGKTGLETTVDGVGGTGFLNPGGDPAAPADYLARLNRQPDNLNPDVVLIQCGRNDIGYPKQAEQTAVDGVINRTHERWPHARVVMLGPLPWAVPIDASVIGIDDFFRAKAVSLGLAYIDGLTANWITADNAPAFVGPVPQHPNNTGYDMIASHVAEELLRMPEALPTS